MGDNYRNRGGRARRLIDLQRWDDRTVVGWLEDDFHHFGVTVMHEEGHVVDVAVAAPRHPYSTCPGSASALRRVIGAPLIRRSSDIGGLIDMRLQCTHVFDLAGLLMAHAAQGRIHRTYEVTVEDRDSLRSEGQQRRILGRGSAMLRQDGIEVLGWDLDGDLITGPHEWAGQSVRDGFRERTERMDIEAAEHATILRRTIMIAGGRGVDHLNRPLPGERSVPAVCHTFQPGQREHAQRMNNPIRNYEQSSEGMLALVKTKA